MKVAEATCRAQETEAEQRNKQSLAYRPHNSAIAERSKLNSVWANRSTAGLAEIRHRNIAQKVSLRGVGFLALRPAKVRLRGVVGF